MRQNLLSILVSNHFGVLMRVTTIFSRRTCNIKSLTVAETQDPAISRITILFEATPEMAGQIEKLLEKQEDVVRAVCKPAHTQLERELVLVKVNNSQSLRDDLEMLARDYHVHPLSLEDEVAVVEFTGDINQTENFIHLMSQYGLVEVCRTGAAAMEQGPVSIYQ